MPTKKAASLAIAPAPRHRVLCGMDYRDRRVEPGEVVEDVPEVSLPWLLEQGLVERVPDATPLHPAHRRSAHANESQEIRDATPPPSDPYEELPPDAFLAQPGEAEPSL